MKKIELDIKVDDKLRPEYFADKLTALEENEMELFKFLLGRPAGVILTADTDKLIAKILAGVGLIQMEDGDKVIMPQDVRDAYEALWSDELILRWRKRNWMYKCIDAGKTLYGVMTWEALRDLFALQYPHAEMDEVKELFNSTPDFNQWFTERDGKLVLNGFEKGDYYKYLEQEIQGDLPFYVPTKEEIIELYEQGCLMSRESHGKLRDFIKETWKCGQDAADLKMSELYDFVNNRVRISDVADRFAEGNGDGQTFPFESDEIQFKFLELFMEMSRECRIRDNRGHDWYEMAAIMAKQGRDKPATKPAVKRVKIGRNDPCPCGSGKKYKNCCGSPLLS